MEKSLSVIILLYLMNAIWPLWGGVPDRNELSHAGSSEIVIKSIVYAVTAVFIRRHWAVFTRGAASIRWIWLLTGLAIISVSWSEFPYLTLRGDAALVATTAFGIYWGTRYTISEQLRLLAIACALALASSCILALCFPEIGVEQAGSAGAWKGVFIEKNALGQTAVFAILVFTFVPLLTRWQRWSGIFMACTVLLLSNSATGILVTLVIVLTLPLYGISRRPAHIKVPLLFGICLVIMCVALSIQSIAGATLQSLDRSSDLTGRSELWNVVLQSINKRPWLGYGFSGFWQGTNGEWETVAESVGWTPGFSHNGFLDVLLNVGIVGLTIFLIGYFATCRECILYFAREKTRLGVWLCTFLLFTLLYNITEGFLLTQNNIYWAVYIATAINVSSVSAKFSALQEQSQ